LLTEACRGEGGILVNKDGYRYLQDYELGPPDPWPRLKAMELGPRDRLSQAFWHEQQKGRTVSTRWGEVVHLDLRHLGEKKINERLPMIRDLATSYVGADPVHELVPVRPVVHYMMGGIHTDIDAATPLPGLFAAGGVRLRQHQRRQPTGIELTDRAAGVRWTGRPPCRATRARGEPARERIGGAQARRRRRASASPICSCGKTAPSASPGCVRR
jgi:succinate dehydrogenase/fumarate reductase flavoprotein subunit